MPRQFIDKIIIQLRYHREASGLSQIELAELLKIGLRSYQRYESGESVPSIDLLYAISKILNFNLKDLFGVDESNIPIKGLRFYEGPEAIHFEEHPLVRDSKLLEILQCRDLQKALDKNDLTLVRKCECFQSSPFFLTVSTPRMTLLNPRARELTGFNVDLVPTQTGHDDIRALGSIWWILIDKGSTYFDQEISPIFPSGKALIKGKYIFVNSKSKYFVLGLSDIMFLP